MNQELLIVGIGGFIGSIVRYLVYVGFAQKNWTDFPWATLSINVLGCFIIGFLSAWLEKALPNHRQIYLAGSVGFLGAFTTFSAFGLETLNLLKNQGFLLALANILANVLIGLAAVWLGRMLI